MLFTHTFTETNGQTVNFTVNDYPDKCPICEKQGQPNFISAVGTVGQPNPQVFVAYRCPVKTCRGLYIANYTLIANRPGNEGYPTQIKVVKSFRFLQVLEFAPNLKTVSATFCEIFQQAAEAEANGLSQIIGPAYRKALEFLVKDFVIKQKVSSDSQKQELVKQTYLGKVIDEFIDEPVIKQCAKRATWLGNDETHYVRKWEEKDINDLKTLIRITQNFIDMSIDAERYLMEMPEGKGSPP